MKRGVTGVSASGWTDPPARPIRYSLADWIADRRAALLDARKGVPGLDGGCLTTHHLELLRSQMQDACNLESLAGKQDCAQIRDQLSGSFAEAANVRAELKSAEEALDAISRAPTEEELRHRRGGEDWQPEMIVRTRRTAEHAKRRKRAEEALMLAQQKLVSLEAEAARLNDVISAREEITLLRSARIHDYTRRRGAAYLRRLARRHKDGARLVSELEPRWLDPPD